MAKLDDICAFAMALSKDAADCIEEEELFEQEEEE